MQAWIFRFSSRKPKSQIAAIANMSTTAAGEEVDEGAVLAFFLLQSGFLVFGGPAIAHPLRLATLAPGPSASVALAKIALASSPAVA